MKFGGHWVLWPFNPLSSKIDGGWAGMANLAPGDFMLEHIRQGFCEELLSKSWSVIGIF